MPLRLVPSQAVLALAFIGVAPRSSFGQAVRRPPDPVTMDPVQIDTAFPPSTEELEFASGGARLNGFLYLAGGPGHHPTVILLHGLPGTERNLDLAQALRRAGMNVLYFSYRGAWGSGGTFTFAHTLEDVAAAVQFVRSDSSVKTYRIDPKRLVILGHSMGGWDALMSIAADSSISCAVALDFWNLGTDGRQMKLDQQTDSVVTAYVDWVTAPGAPIHADSGRALTAELEEHADSWDLERQSSRLRIHPLLIISTTTNEYHPQLIAALHAARADNVTALQWKTDHGFSGQRIRLAHTVISWLHSHCGS